MARQRSSVARLRSLMRLLASIVAASFTSSDARKSLVARNAFSGEWLIADLRSARSCRVTARDDDIFARAADSCLGSIECLKKVPSIRTIAMHVTKSDVVVSGVIYTATAFHILN